MKVIGISRGLRLGLEQAFTLAFNAELQAACEQWNLKVFAFNWSRSEDAPCNCFEGNRSFEELYREGADFPACAWWIGPGGDENKQKPRRFSGTMTAYWRYFLFAPGLYKSALLQDRREAIEAAHQAALVGMDIPEGRYNKDLSWGDPAEFQWLDADNNNQHKGFVQMVEFSASFEVNV